jgi:hypothetical protein
MDQIKGIPSAFWETGTEGVYWSIQEPDKSYDGLHILKNGDWLMIVDPDGNTVWGGLVSIDPTVRSYGHYWVHGMPDNFDKDTWYKIFVEEKHTGILIKQVYENGLSHTRQE